MHRADGLCYPGSASRLSCRRRQRHGRGSATQSGEERYRGVTLMFIAMNRFQVLPGEEKAFENVWLSRDTFLEGVPGRSEAHTSEIQSLMRNSYADFCMTKKTTTK